MELDHVRFLLGTKCGVPLELELLDKEVKPHTLTYHVALVESRDKTKPLCSGALVAPSYVLTTARCVASSSIGSLLVRVGVHDYAMRNDSQQFIHVQAIIQHPKYQDNEVRTHDLTLLKLSECAISSKFKHTGIVCLPMNMTHSLAGADMVISGWKMDPDGALVKDTALKASLQNGISNGVCRSILQGRAVNDHQVCAVGPSSDVCEGNEGGKLFCSTSVPLASTRKVRLTFSSFYPVYSKQHRQ